MDASSSSPPPPPGAGSSGPPAASGTIGRRLSPGVVLVVAILAMVFFIIGLLNLLVQNLLRLRRARRRRGRVGDAAAGGGSPTALQGQLRHLFDLHDAGVDQAAIDALPVFPYRAIRRAAVAAAGKDKGHGKGHPAPAAFDCAVCLCEFADDDQLRLLPACGHAFHVPCIDAWLLSHSTCPLCRGSVLGDAAGLDHVHPPAGAVLLVLESESLPDDADGAGGPGDRDTEAPLKDDAEEEVVEVKLGKLRCVDGGNASARDLAVVVDGTGSGNGRGGLGQRRCLSMGSYEYVLNDHAALRVTVKTTPRRAPASSTTSRRRHALSACDLGIPKKGAWEAAVTEGAAALNKDSFSTSKIWMVSAARRDDGGRPAAEPPAERRAVSFRWPAMAAGSKKPRGGEASWNVEAAGSCGDNAVPSLEEERPWFARAAMLWVAGGGRQGSHS